MQLNSIQERVCEIELLRNNTKYVLYYDKSATLDEMS